MARETKKRKTPNKGKSEGEGKGKRKGKYKHKGEGKSGETQTQTQIQTQTQTVLVDQSLSVSGRPLPAGSDTDKGGASIVLFYQYKEPVWTEHEFQRALKLFLSIGRRFSMTGRGRIAPEGVNCTLTGPSAAEVRGFCQALRDEWGVVGAGAGAVGGADSIDKSNGGEHNTTKGNNNNYNFSDKDLFQATDFKITDGLPQSQKFKSLSVRKTNELVAYGLEGEKAPSIEKFGGEHLTAVDYHEALRDKDTVVIDVRNAYETAIGTIVPPEGGATLLDPKLRNSREWPKWLASEETQKKLNGKKILTFCTGGIRCERATALINQMATVSKSKSSSSSAPDTPKQHNGSVDNTKNTTAAAAKTLESGDGAHQNTNSTSNTNDAAAATAKTFQPNGVYHMRGGIERYLKTYPQGGFWSGKNYLFDKRMEQLPELKDSSKVEDEVATTLNAKCCLCRKPWTTYRGQHKCGQIQCGVPVLVCDACHVSLSSSNTNTNGNSNSNSSRLRCELCREGYRAPQGNPDLVAMRKRAEKITAVGAAGQSLSAATTEPMIETAPLRPPLKFVSDRLFLNRLPLTTRKSEIEEWLRTPIRQLHWITDRDTGAFYGSCIVRIDVFSKLLLAIKKHTKTRGSRSSAATIATKRMLVAHKTDENVGGGPLREFLGPFPGTTSTDVVDFDVDFDSSNRRRRNGKKRKRTKLQQPKIFRVLARPCEVWPPSNQIDKEYPPLGRIQ